MPLRRARILLLAVLALVTSVVLPAAPVAADAGIAPSDPPNRTITYQIRTKGTVHGDVAEFARLASVTLNDRRGWSLGGSILWRQVNSRADLTLWLASPSAVESFAPRCDAAWSCRVGSNVVINDVRWRTGTPVWPDVHEYHHYVVNHEVGHWLGMGHRGCTGRGAPAPVMQQQSISLGGCVTNTWPTAAEKSDVARRYDVAVRLPRPEVYAVKQHGRTGTEVHGLDGVSTYRSFEGHWETAAGTTSPGQWDFAAADMDRDGVDDVVGIKKSAPSGRVEVHVLDGASRYRSWQLHARTVLPASGHYTFDVADVDGDGFQDVVMINRFGSGNRTTVHVLDGARKFAAFLLHGSTPLPNVSAAGWTFLTGHHDRDGVPDLYAVKRNGASGHTEVHVLDGASGYRSWSGHAVTPLGWTDASYDFAVDDFDGDGWDEVWAVKRNGASGKTEIHVLADRTYARWTKGTPTALPATDGVPGWRFLVD